jgi:hypothetical protein
MPVKALKENTIGFFDPLHVVYLNYSNAHCKGVFAVVLHRIPYSKPHCGKVGG